MGQCLTAGRAKPRRSGTRARSSAGEHCLHTAGVAGSNPAAPTIYPSRRAARRAGVMSRQKPPPKRRNPVARTLRNLRPQRIRNRKTYTRKGRRKAPDFVSVVSQCAMKARAGGFFGPRLRAAPLMPPPLSSPRAEQSGAPGAVLRRFGPAEGSEATVGRPARQQGVRGRNRGSEPAPGRSERMAGPLKPLADSARGTRMPNGDAPFV